jgi:hypothetical protein
MTIDEAIKELTNLNENYASQLWSEPKRAIQLGIEALKRVQEYKTHHVLSRHKLLLGETEE